MDDDDLGGVRRSSGLLLPRARGLFAGFLLLLSFAQLLEVVDADTPWFPDRAASLLALFVVVAWGVLVLRTRRASVLADVVLVAVVTALGLGLGRNGAMLVTLLGVVPLRALHSSRGRVTTVVAGLLVGFGLVTWVHHGVDRVIDLGLVVVVVGLAAFAATLRRLAEVLAEHDLQAHLDGVATAAAASLVAATSVSDVDEVERGALDRIRTLRTGATEDPTSVRLRMIEVPGRLEELGAAVEGTGPVASVLRRLVNDVRLARERVRSEARYRAIAEESRDGIYLRDLPPDPAFRYLNPAAEALLGVSARQVADDPGVVRLLLDPDDHAELVARLTSVIDEPVSVRLCLSDERVRWVSVQERLIDVGDETRTVLGTVRDVTRQLEAEEALRRVVERERAAADELRHLDAMRATFLQAVSHELRTPLSAVIGAAQTLDAHGDRMQDEQRGRMLDIVRRQSARLERLLTDLLDVDRLSHGAIVPDRRPVDLLAMAERVAAGVDGSERITVVGDPVVVAVDGPQVERIIDNLLRNAIRHTPPDSTVTCWVTADGSGAELVVEDDGPGVPDGLKGELFQAFVQGPRVGSSASPGTGIGLALVQALSELHGGHAWVEDRVGGGARFCVSLPGPEVEATEALVGTHRRLP